jgi:hypothetical protein
MDREEDRAQIDAMGGCVISLTFLPGVAERLARPAAAVSA